MGLKILVINPGSTSIKVSVFDGDDRVFSVNIHHSADELMKYPTVNSQLPFRMRIVSGALAEAGVDLSEMDAIVGRGGITYSMESGTYEIEPLIVAHAREAVTGVHHPANLGVQIADELCRRYGVRGFFVNPPVVDEYQELARTTGIKGIYRKPVTHALNLKETAIRHAKLTGAKYDERNYIGAHLGGGISITAHRRGRMVDAINCTDGEGPMAATRCGGIVVKDLIDYMERRGLSCDDVRELCVKTGGFVDHLGTSDAKEVEERAYAGDETALKLWNTLIYQVGKTIGSMAAVLQGKVDGILLSGGMVKSKNLVSQIEDYCGWIAPVTAYPGEFEMEALAAGAMRALTGEEEVRKYTGVPVWGETYVGAL